MQDLTITLVQADLAWEDKQRNLDKFSRILGELKHKPDLVVLPEMFNTGFVTEPAALAEAPDGPTMNWIAGQAKALECVITGSFTVHTDGNYFNRLVWMQPDGSYRHYDKRHLFRFGNEHLQFAQGTGRIISEVKGWKVLPLICYDLRFPVWSKNRYIGEQYEYDLLIYVANWPGRRSYAFRHLTVARAIENQAYVVAVNRVGMDGKGTLHQGDSAVIDFKGRHLVEIPPDVEDVETVTLSGARLAEFREGFKVALDWDDFDVKL